ncbi:hypothetical protein AYL99_11929 [Fonsecaea erecta]|uniref:Uncharacterized protein n=1 Tax=Fonsecaea erecta TaxID=1367422 RepID=A0A178Z2G2_9EURO|nr:hypothetical protein AYL99_11929 [Fonsecaea erecta]OAP53907.1 hypothetical protein AYL99_11929 [Fonsecaea erecta]
MRDGSNNGFVGKECEDVMAVLHATLSPEGLREMVELNVRAGVKVLLTKPIVLDAMDLQPYYDEYAAPYVTKAEPYAHLVNTRVNRVSKSPSVLFGAIRLYQSVLASFLSLLRSTMFAGLQRATAINETLVRRFGNLLSRRTFDSPYLLAHSVLAPNTFFVASTSSEHQGLLWADILRLVCQIKTPCRMRLDETPYVRFWGSSYSTAGPFAAMALAVPGIRAQVFSGRKMDLRPEFVDVGYAPFRDEDKGLLRNPHICEKFVQEM